MEISVRCCEALNILKDHPKIDARSFAEKFWPNNHMHKKVSFGSMGATTGKAAWLCAGSYLGKLIKKKLVRHTYDFYGYELTNLGATKISEVVK